MKDSLGNELEVGDTVAYIWGYRGYRRLRRGIVEKITAKRVKVEEEEGCMLSDKVVKL